MAFSQPQDVSMDGRATMATGKYKESKKMANYDDGPHNSKAGGKHLPGETAHMHAHHRQEAAHDKIANEVCQQTKGPMKGSHEIAGGHHGKHQGGKKGY